MATNNRVKKTGFIALLADDIISQMLEELGEQPAASSNSRAMFFNLIKSTLLNAHKAAQDELIKTQKGEKCAKNICLAQDEIIRATHNFANNYVFPPLDNSTKNNTLSIAAVGGYGRATLAPGSDIDLLFILPEKQTEQQEKRNEQIIEYILYMLWDLGQKVGHAVRSLDECLKMAKTDMTIRTATLEARFLSGNEALFETLVKRFEKEIMSKTGPEFIAAKLHERDLRHERMGNTRYVVEPNIKEGKGGLRDLNTLFWIGKYFYQVKSNADLVKKGVFSASELRLFERSENFLWAVRCHLHFLTNRADETLTFDVQPELAQRMGFSDRAGMLGVERFMKRYFLAAKDVGDLTRVFCSVLEFSHASRTNILSLALEGLRIKNNKQIKNEPDYIIERGRINVKDTELFAKNPINLIKIFWLVEREELLFHPEAFKHITRSLKYINSDLRNNEQANQYFLEILTSSVSVERTLRRMNESGVLGRFVPEFGKIVALMQFNMYHHFTVDEHLIRSVGVMASIENGELKKELPLTHELLPTLNDVKLLYIALFLHDIAKGRKEDHSIAGARIAKRFCKRLGLSAAETETVSWLIKYHLLMSEIAQSRDIQDPTTAKNFADIVQSPARLALLMILTACDIRAVGPGVWTGWKGSLLRALYYATEPLLSGGHSQISQGDRVEKAKQTLTEHLDNWSPSEIEKYLNRHYSPYWLRTDLELQLKHAKMIRNADLKKQAFSGTIHVKSFEQITEISFYTADHPRLLTMIAGACTMAEASIVGAQIVLMRDGQALDTLQLRRAFQSDEDENIRAHRIVETVRELLEGTRYLDKKPVKNTRLNRRLKPFKVPGEVLISNNLSNKFTVLEVSGLDRTGLLRDLTMEISELNLTIGSAHISTYGEKAVDVFYVTDLTGAKIEQDRRQAKIHDRLLEILEPNRKL
ncbi:MAG: [protein-PII] uridylyltransferase [Devosiaceae bacterium]|nr:[protein-PII] uridylyltransferase [Devosiaceae bacterium]